jgi:hypothetical protein
MSRLQVWVDFITVPSGNRILSGLFVGHSFFTAAPFTMKCAVAPESRIAYSGGLLCWEDSCSLEDNSSLVRSAVVAVALSQSCLVDLFEVMTVLSSSSSSLL